MSDSFEDLRRRATEQWESLQRSPRPRILVSTATCGRSVGALEVLETLQGEFQHSGLDCTILEVGCIGLCYAEPIVCITKPPRPGICYGSVTPEKAVELVKAYLLGDNPLPEYALGTVGEGNVEGISPLPQAPVFRHQVRRTLRNCGFIDPTNINHYIAGGGYSGFSKALQLGPEQVLEEIKRSGLRGRGGAGFPTWRKWLFCREAKAATKYLICNASEGDPGTFSNRLLLESDPHSVLEGMLIAAYALNAQEGYIYCPAEYPLALDRLRTAVDQMEQCGLLGDGVLGSSFNFHVKIKPGAGAYICGEESALIECIEGKRGVPRLRPPFPPVWGLWGCPTIVNNVETLACVTLVLQNGAARFAELGTETGRGTKLFCLSGNIRHSGVIEVPFGITLREMLYDVGGGALDDKRIKAVQTGGPAGGCLPPELFDLAVDHDSLLEFGSSIGSGGVVVLDEDTCMVDVACNALDFAQRECCGQCVPCRLGTKQMFEILKDITEGRGTPEDLELLVELAEAVKAGSLCGLGQTAPNLLLATIRYFRDEYEAHVKEKRCPAAGCKRMIPSPC